VIVIGIGIGRGTEIRDGLGWSRTRSRMEHTIDVRPVDLRRSRGGLGIDACPWSGSTAALLRLYRDDFVSSLEAVESGLPSDACHRRRSR
jgi:hypothetical protein